MSESSKQDGFKPSEQGTDEHVPVAEESLEEEGPRRAASAQFHVEESTVTNVAMREAMDPANQSLGDALRLSYRLLQLGILILVVMFLFSGFETIREGYSGVKMVFGRIVGTPGSEELEPGLELE